MRRDLVQEVLDAASDELFEDVLYTHTPNAPVTVEKSIFGIEPQAERFEMMGQQMRQSTHFTRALKAKFPDLAPGDIFDDGIAYRVVDSEPIGDGRFEISISLVVNA